jgi:hypothetical protein
MKLTFFSKLILLVSLLLAAPSLLAQTLQMQDKYTNETATFRVLEKADHNLIVDGVIVLEKSGRLYKRVFNGFINVAWFGAKGDGITDDSQAVQKALNTGYSVQFNKGVYLVANLALPYSFRGQEMRGVGYNHWDLSAGTTLKSSRAEVNLLTPVNGCDWIKVSGMRFEGDNKGSIAFNGKFGAGVSFENVGFYNFKSYGILSRQGLYRIKSCFFSNNGIGAELFSDSSIENSELTGGNICLNLLAGGNRLTNCWINSAKQHLLVLAPLDESTSHQNTSLTNVYLGEVIGHLKSKNPDIQILIHGNKVKRVQQVQFSNSFFVHTTNTKNNNAFIYLENADEIILNALNVLGRHTYVQENIITSYFIRGTNSNNIKISNSIIKGVNGNAIIQDSNSHDWDITNNQFINCAGHFNANAVVNIISPMARPMISNNRFIDYRQNQMVFAVNVTGAQPIMFQNNYIQYPSAIMVKSDYKFDYNDLNFR